MSTAALTPRFDDGAHPSVESLLDRLNALTHERQELRSAGTSGPALEDNRLEIVRLQWELSRALIERYGPSAA